MNAVVGALGATLHFSGNVGPEMSPSSGSGWSILTQTAQMSQEDQARVERHPRHGYRA